MDSHIGYGAPISRTPEPHGEPLGPDEVRLAKEFYGWDPDAQFLVPDGVREALPGLSSAAAGHRAKCGVEQTGRGLSEEVPRRGVSTLYCMPRHTLPPDWDKDLPIFSPYRKGIASRDASAKAQNAIARRVPWLLGGSADLWPSTKTLLDLRGRGRLLAARFTAATTPDATFTSASASTRCVPSTNGMALSGLRPYGSSFLVFTYIAAARSGSAR